MVYLEEDLNGFHRQDYFLAQIAYYIAMANSKDPKKVDFNTFLMKFGKKPTESKAKTDADAVTRRMVESRSTWGRMFGLEVPMDDLVEDSDVIRGPWPED